MWAPVILVSSSGTLFGLWDQVSGPGFALGLPVAAHDEVAGKAGSEADRIDPEVGQVHKMDGVAQKQEIAVRGRIEPFPQTQAALPPLGGKMITSKRRGSATSSKNWPA